MTELMLRLLKDGKIVGYELIKDGLHFQDTTCPVYADGYCLEYDREDAYILWDSFELGVKVLGNWRFEGDRFENCDWHTLATLRIAESGKWVLVADDEAERFNKQNALPFIDHAPYWQLIGNIHEETPCTNS